MAMFDMNTPVRKCFPIVPLFTYTPRNSPSPGVNMLAPIYLEEVPFDAGNEH